MSELSLLDEFLSESREHLGQMEQDFMLLEKGGNTDPEVLNRIFRAVHTVKGSSGFFGLERIGSVAHVMESVFDKMREQILLPTPEVLDVLLSGLDCLNALLADVGASNAQDTSEIERRVLSCLETTEKTIPPPLKKQVDAEKPWGPADIEWDKIPSGSFLYRLDFDLKDMETQQNLNPVALLNHLQSLGVVHDGFVRVPPEDLQQGVPNGSAIYQVLFSSVLEPELVITATHLDSKQVLSIAIPDRVAEHKESKNAGTPPLVNLPEHKTPEVDCLKVKVDILDRLMQLAGELVLVRNQQLLLSEQDKNMDCGGITQRLDLVTSALQETIMRTRMQPIGNVFGRFSRVVRDLGRKLGKDIVLETEGNEVELDKNILDALADPITHLIRNSCDHGIENPAQRSSLGKPAVGVIRLRAYHEGGQIHVDISDDGQGISRDTVQQKALDTGLKTREALAGMSDNELLSLILLPGFSTAQEVTDVSGRGVGMDVVKTSIERLGGIVEIESEEGQGTNIHLRLPLTLAIIPCMVVEVLKQRFAIPQIDLEELVCLYDEDVVGRVECAGAREVFRLRDSLLTLVHLEEILQRTEVFSEDVRRTITETWRLRRQDQVKKFQDDCAHGSVPSCSLNFAVLKVGVSRFGLIVDRIIGTEEIVVKPMHRAVKDLGIYSGATVLGDGSVAMILDVLGISRHAAFRLDTGPRVETKDVVDVLTDQRKLMLFNNGQHEQMAIPMEKIKRIEHISMDKVEHIGDREYFVVDQQSTRLLRLDRYLDIAQGDELEEMFLLLPNQHQQPYGILVSHLSDVGDYDCHMDHQSYRGQGVEGTLLIQGRMTLLIDPDAIMALAEPEMNLEACHG